MGNKSSLMLQDDEIKQISDETGFSNQQIEKLYSRFTQLDRSHCGALSRSDLLSIPELAINPICDRLIEIFFTSDPSKANSADRASQQSNDDACINFRQFMRVLAAFRSLSSPGSSSLPSTPVAASGDKNLRSKGSTGMQENNSSDDSRDELRREIRKRTSKSPPTVAMTTNGEASTNESRKNAVLMNDSLRDRLLFVFKIYDADNDGRISFSDLRTILKLMVGNYIDDMQLDKIATRAFVEVDRDSDGFIEFHEFCNVFAGKDMDLFRLSI